MSIPDINALKNPTSLPDATPQTDKKLIKGLAWAATTIAATGGTVYLGAVSACAGLSFLTLTVLCVSDGDFGEALLHTCGCGIAALGVKVTLVAIPYLRLCLNNACYHLP